MKSVPAGVLFRNLKPNWCKKKKNKQKTHKYGLEREQINTRVTLLNAIKLLLALQRQVPNREVRNQSQR